MPKRAKSEERSPAKTPRRTMGRQTMDPSKVATPKTPVRLTKISQAVCDDQCKIVEIITPHRKTRSSYHPSSTAKVSEMTPKTRIQKSITKSSKKKTATTTSRSSVPFFVSPVSPVSPPCSPSSTAKAVEITPSIPKSARKSSKKKMETLVASKSATKNRRTASVRDESTTGIVNEADIPAATTFDGNTNSEFFATKKARRTLVLEPETLTDNVKANNVQSTNSPMASKIETAADSSSVPLSILPITSKAAKKSRTSASVRNESVIEVQMPADATLGGNTNSESMDERSSIPLETSVKGKEEAKRARRTLILESEPDTFTGNVNEKHIKSENSTPIAKKSAPSISKNTETVIESASGPPMISPVLLPNAKETVKRARRSAEVTTQPETLTETYVPSISERSPVAGKFSKSAHQKIHTESRPISAEYTVLPEQSSVVEPKSAKIKSRRSHVMPVNSKPITFNIENDIAEDGESLTEHCSLDENRKSATQPDGNVKIKEENDEQLDDMSLKLSAKAKQNNRRKTIEVVETMPAKEDDRNITIHDFHHDPLDISVDDAFDGVPTKSVRSSLKDTSVAEENVKESNDTLLSAKTHKPTKQNRRKTIGVVVTPSPKEDERNVTIEDINHDPDDNSAGDTVEIDPAEGIHSPLKENKDTLVAAKFGDAESSLTTDTTFEMNSSACTSDRTFEITETPNSSKKNIHYGTIDLTDSPIVVADSPINVISLIDTPSSIESPCSPQLATTSAASLIGEKFNVKRIIGSPLCKSILKKNSSRLERSPKKADSPALKHSVSANLVTRFLVNQPAAKMPLHSPVALKKTPKRLQNAGLRSTEKLTKTTTKLDFIGHQKIIGEQLKRFALSPNVLSTPLRGIRKRSFSVTESEKKHRVRFENDLENRNENEMPTKRNRTQSNAEKTTNAMREVQSATKFAKLPDFAAIHLKQQQQMESIADYETRKLRRHNELSAKKVPKNVQPKSDQAVAQKSLFAPSKTVLPPANKVVDRRKKHMNLYKKTSDKNDAKKEEMLKGVRLNRRFELQMEYRRNLE